MYWIQDIWILTAILQILFTFFLQNLSRKDSLISAQKVGTSLWSKKWSKSVKMTSCWANYRIRKWKKDNLWVHLMIKKNTCCEYEEVFKKNLLQMMNSSLEKKLSHLDSAVSFGWACVLNPNLSGGSDRPIKTTYRQEFHSAPVLNRGKREGSKWAPLHSDRLTLFGLLLVVPSDQSGTKISHLI